MTNPIHCGAVEWTGENPGIFLKESADGLWTGLMMFFRIVYSSRGMGSGVVVIDCPDSGDGLPRARNFCITDNEALARFLVTDFFSHYQSLRTCPAVGALTYLPLVSGGREGDTLSAYREVVRSAEFEVICTWRQLSAPYAVSVPAPSGSTGKHDMHGVFLDATDASVTVNGTPLRGMVVPRDFAGSKKTSAFLAFGETWIRAG